MMSLGLLACISIVSSNPIQITIFEITNVNASVGAVGGHVIALEEINSDSFLLPNYTLDLQGMCTKQPHLL